VGLSRPVTGLLYLYFLEKYGIVSTLCSLEVSNVCLPPSLPYKCDFKPAELTGIFERNPSAFIAKCPTQRERVTFCSLMSLKGYGNFN
jgi:hypothetical protein